MPIRSMHCFVPRWIEAREMIPPSAASVGVDYLLLLSIEMRNGPGNTGNTGNRIAAGKLASASQTPIQQKSEGSSVTSNLYRSGHWAD